MIETVATLTGVYLVGFLLINILVRRGLRDVPAAHGQIVGTQIGCIVAIAWPVAIPALLAFAIYRLAIIAIAQWNGDGHG
mgnify:CR=1 FL=1